MPESFDNYSDIKGMVESERKYKQQMKGGWALAKDYQQFSYMGDTV